MCFTHSRTCQKTINHGTKPNRPNSSPFLNKATKSSTPFPPLCYCHGCTLRTYPTGSFLKQPCTAISIFQSRCTLVRGHPLINLTTCCQYHQLASTASTPNFVARHLQTTRMRQYNKNSLHCLFFEEYCPHGKESPFLQFVCNDS